MSETSPTNKNLLMQVLLALPLSLVLFGGLIVMLLLGFEVIYAERSYPGVSMQGLDLSGLTQEDARDLLAEALPYTYEGRITLTYGEKLFRRSRIQNYRYCR